MDVVAFLDRVRTLPFYDGQIDHVEVLPERPGAFAEPSRPLPRQLAELLARRGVERLYSHQVALLEHARAGRDVVVVSGTASGKTLCYNLPILEAVLADPTTRALYLFPAKALAQDQLKGLVELLDDTGGEPNRKGGRRKAEGGARKAEGERRKAAAETALSARTGGGPIDDDTVLAAQAASPASRLPPSAFALPGVFDGDTPPAQRRRIQAEAQLVLSNPDMLHASILPYHPKWAGFFGSLRFVVLDEVHTYRGILGANVACVLRRLLRVCEHYGSRPVVLAASATIANPGELTSRLVGRDVAVVDQDGSPRGRKHFALWNPSPLGKDRLARRSATDDAVTLMTEAMLDGAQTLVFARTRQATELVHRYVKESLESRHSPLARQVRAYRGGYLPIERRQIEQELFSGALRGVAATNALELGIDVGSLDVALLAGYPGTIASTWQQAGRCGRRHDESLAILLAGNDPVDQYLWRHPEYFFAQPPEHAVVDPENPYVLANHLKAAAFELPLTEADAERFGPLALEIAELLCESGELSEVGGEFYFAGGQNPSARMSLRHMSDNTFSIVLRGKEGSAESAAAGPRAPRAKPHEVIANVDAISAPELVYPQAVYLHNGESYFVRELDLVGKVAYVERHEMDYYTQAVLESNVTIKGERRTRPAVPLALLSYGEVDVSWQTVAFKKIKFGTRENIGQGPVDIPAQSLATTAMWLSPLDSLRAAMKAAGFRTSEAMVGLRNLAITALPMVAMCDSRDLGGVVDSKNLGRSTMILYDRYPGGLGYCEKGFEQMEQVLVIAHEMVRDCPCAEGCPSCVGLPNLRPAIHSDPDLSRGYPIPNKAATVALLDLLCGAGTDQQSRPTVNAHPLSNNISWCGKPTC